jgi:hypothetical protein
MEFTTVQDSFDQFVLSTCQPSHVKAARYGVTDWIRMPNSDNVYFSPSMNITHVCDHECKQWVVRFIDGVKICAISGKGIDRHSPYTMQPTSSPLKRTNRDYDQQQQQQKIDNTTPLSSTSSSLDRKRHQDKPIVGSSAYLAEKFPFINTPNPFIDATIPPPASVLRTNNNSTWNSTATLNTVEQAIQYNSNNNNNSNNGDINMMVFDDER